MSACAPEASRINELELLVEREGLYRDLADMETGLSDGVLSGLSSFDHVASSAEVNRPFSVSPAQFEVSRNRRALAFEQLAALPAPQMSSNDYDAFWEIHQAYRFAVQTGLSGSGKVGLVYSRPYSADHLSNPLVSLLTRLDQPESRILPADKQAFLDGFRSTTRRLELDLAAKTVPPASVVSRMLEQIEQSPLADQTSLDAYLYIDPKKPPQPESAFLADARILLNEEMLKEVSLYRDILKRIDASLKSESAPRLVSASVMDTIIRQATSGEFTAKTCYDAALREGSTVLAAFLEHLDIAETLPDGSFISNESPVSVRFSEWQQRTPLFVTTTSDDDSDPSLKNIGPKDASAPPVSPSFQSFTDALQRLKREWTTLFNRPFQPPDYSESGFIGFSPPTRIQPVILQYDSLSPDSSAQQRTVAFRTLIRYPLSQAVVDTLLRDYPGAALTEAARENREDRPALSRKLPNLAFDLGWPDYALALMADRGAFDDAPRIDAARLYRMLQFVTEAQIEAGLISGDMTTETATALLKARFEVDDSTVNDILDRLRVQPGLACGRLAGYRKFQSLKARAEGVLGDRFNVRELNDIILSSGSRPLQIVETNVDTWVARKAGVIEDKSLPE